MYKIKPIIFLLIIVACNASVPDGESQLIRPGAYQLDEYLPALENKKVGLCVNHTSLVNQTHLVDTLLSHEVNIQKVFTPEHGFRGTASAGELIGQQDVSYDFEVVSLYGKNKKPTSEQMSGIDILIFDLQDVGARFYTYISTMHYLMEACAEQGIKLIILDRPNPNGSYIDGPVLDTTYRSFVGMHPIPIVHGLTVGELAMMIQGEKWLENGTSCDLDIIKVKNWDHGIPYALPVKTSPNLPNEQAVALYPSLCLFEQTSVSVGRGTDNQFQVIGHPNYDGNYSFTPVSKPGASNPKWENITCYGDSLFNKKIEYAFSLKYLIKYYNALKDLQGETFFKDYFHLLAGNKSLQKQIEAGWTENEIRAAWKDELRNYKILRDKYLLYPDRSE
jgi:uncharacterized protein YbbC (DUF1343 family)